MRNRLRSGIIAFGLLVHGAALAKECPFDPLGPRAKGDVDLLCEAMAEQPASAEEKNRGEHLFKLGGCNNCHTADPKHPLGGGLKLETPKGNFFTPNISPDKEHGIGNWTFSQFRKAMREGIRPDGQHYYPAFPFRSFSKMTDQDLVALYKYLKGQPSQTNENKPHELDLLSSTAGRAALGPWKFLNFPSKGPDKDYNMHMARGSFEPNLKTDSNPEGHSAEWNRGAYLTEAVAHCTECHTPRDTLSLGLRPSKWMSGTHGTGGYAPDITRNENTAVGKWTKEQWVSFLRSGKDPVDTEDKPLGEMAKVLQGTAGLPDSDLNAIAEYMISIQPPVHHED